jgi:hypothetical protein
MPATKSAPEVKTSTSLLTPPAPATVVQVKFAIDQKTTGTPHLSALAVPHTGKPIRGLLGWAPIFASEEDAKRYAPMHPTFETSVIPQ